MKSKIPNYQSCFINIRCWLEDCRLRSHALLKAYRKHRYFSQLSLFSIFSVLQYWYLVSSIGLSFVSHGSMFNIGDSSILMPGVSNVSALTINITCLWRSKQTLSRTASGSLQQCFSKWFYIDYMSCHQCWKTPPRTWNYQPDTLSTHV